MYVCTSFVILPISCEAAYALLLAFIAFYSELLCGLFERVLAGIDTCYLLRWMPSEVSIMPGSGWYKTASRRKVYSGGKVVIFQRVPLPFLIQRDTQKPETASLCAGKIHLAAFHVSCQVTRSLHS